MHQERKLGSEGVSTIEYGNHYHNSEQGMCQVCERENRIFERMAKNGSQILEERMHRVPSYKAYNQKWPFDARKKVLSSEVVFEDTDGVIYVEGMNTGTFIDLIESDEAVEELLAELTAEERDVITKTVEGYKPREIADLYGEHNSSRVRQDKYSAMRKLGAPLNQNMRRNKP